jgi:hypothetical protein
MDSGAVVVRKQVAYSLVRSWIPLEKNGAGRLGLTLTSAD